MEDVENYIYNNIFYFTKYNNKLFFYIYFFVFSKLIFELLASKMAHGIFKCKEDGFYPDPADCWIYHICDGGTHSVRACDEDLYFNPKTGLCDWPMNVDCKQATTKRTTTTPSK